MLAPRPTFKARNAKLETISKSKWGSSPYLQPFFPCAVLGQTSVLRIVPTDHGIRVVASGFVSRGEKGAYGSWNTQLEDNTGITPLESRSLPTTWFDFDVTVSSEALPDDGKR